MIKTFLANQPHLKKTEEKLCSEEKLDEFDLQMKGFKTSMSKFRAKFKVKMEKLGEESKI